MDITELLAFSVENNASDLHLSTGIPPSIRVDGDVRKLDILSSKLKSLGKKETGSYNTDSSKNGATSEEQNKAKEVMTGVWACRSPEIVKRYLSPCMGMLSSRASISSSFERLSVLFCM